MKTEVKMWDPNKKKEKVRDIILKLQYNDNDNTVDVVCVNKIGKPICTLMAFKIYNNDKMVAVTLGGVCVEGIAVDENRCIVVNP